MTVGVGAGSYVGIAIESVAGTYVAPTMTLRTHSGTTLNYVQDNKELRPLNGTADVAGVVPGPSRVEGELSVQLTPDQLVTLLKCSRTTIVKTGAGPYTYVATPNHLAVPAQTFSITLVRNAIPMGFTGCVIGSQKYFVDDEIFVGTFGVLGRTEASQSNYTPTYITTNPYATGNYKLEIPTSTQVYDADTFEMTIDDKAEAQYRLQDASATGARFIKYGAREVTASINRDFEARTEFDEFKAATAKSITMTAYRNATNDSIALLIPSAIPVEYPIEGMDNQDSLIRANVKYNGVYNSGTSKSYEITVKSATSITIP